MKLFFFFTVLFVVFYNGVDSTPLPQATADGLTFCCTEDDGGKKPGTSDRIVNPPGKKDGVRISLQKCLEYSALYCPEPDYPIVGIIGGTTVLNPGDYPHMVALGWRQTDNAGFSWLCGGSLVTEFYVLTAAHCISSRNAGLVSNRPEVVRLGELDFTLNDTVLQDIQIQSIIIHPYYKYPSKYHDIALLKLATPAKLTDFVRPVCLWQNETMEQTIAKAIGWGKTNLAGSGSVTLQTVDLAFFSDQECRESFGETKTMILGVIPQQLCAGNSDGGKDTCRGDSGGPLTINLPTNRLFDCVHHQVGITSFGIGCGSSTPAVYTRVSHYLDWIESIVWP